jgi:hypothetical protein
MFDPAAITWIALTGLVAGTLGGMLGVGGSVIMLPALVMIFGQNRHPGFHQHLYQAAAMIANVLVVLPAFWRHARAGAVVRPALMRMLPAALGFVIVGVMVSNLDAFDPARRYFGASGPVWLGRVLAVFLAYVIVVNIRRLVSGRREAIGTSRVTTARGSAVGAAMGFAAGLMGIGGGAIAVPLQQTLLRLPLRNCIANSTAIIVVTAAAGAVVKNATLPGDASVLDSLRLAGLLAPTAIVGSLIGATLTHRLPVRAVRIAFIVLMAVAAWKMAAV